MQRMVQKNEQFTKVEKMLESVALMKHEGNNKKV